jgi:hypothetical protein
MNALTSPSPAIIVRVIILLLLVDAAVAQAREESAESREHKLRPADALLAPALI